MKISRKRLLGGFVLVLLLVLTAYMLYGHYLGKTVKNVVLSALENYAEVENNPYIDIISDEHYNRFVKRKYWDFTQPGIHDLYYVDISGAVWWLTGARAYITYTHMIYQGDELISGSWDVTVYFTFERQNGQWKVIDVYEAP